MRGPRALCDFRFQHQTLSDTVYNGSKTEQLQELWNASVILNDESSFTLGSNVMMSGCEESLDSGSVHALLLSGSNPEH
ncbi:hypothetical protein NPIL_283501 [Nephila pilipes]|uniref:Uncharacterized protein n=1 Tax=Nephila pilipes TaxID=299642 RepID=A0A8X6QWH0_NEPPI|nr:hypothetical protein NPIL_283501 [Nephila pilipes]